MDASISLPKQGILQQKGEALAVAVALENSRYYTLGCPTLIVDTDHKPLLGILGNRALDTIDNPRLVRIKQRALPWNYLLIYVPGKQQIAADGFSRRKQNAVLHVLAEIATEGVNNNDLRDTMHKQDVRYSGELLTQQITTDNHRTHKSSTEAAVADLKAGPSVITWEDTKG